MMYATTHSTQAPQRILGWVLVVILATGTIGRADHEAAKRFYTDANALFDQSRFAEAMAGYDRALGEDPKFVEAAYNRALASEMVSRDGALESWQRFLEAAGDRPEYKWDVARVQARLQVLKAKPPLPEPMQPARYVSSAGDYYREISLTSEGEQWHELPVKVFLGSAPQLKWQQGAREAYDIWSAVFPTRLVALEDAADVRLTWEGGAFQDGRVGEDMEWVRIKRVGDQLTGRRIAVISVDLSHSWSKDEMRAIMLHEMGHALGIKGHSGTKKDIMYWQMQEKSRQVPVPFFPIPVFWKSLVKEPSQRDINTLIRIYNSSGTIARFD